MARRTAISTLVLTLVVLAGACGFGDAARVTESRPTAMTMTAPDDDSSPRPGLGELQRLVETDDRVQVVDGPAANTEVELRADAADLARQMHATDGEQITLTSEAGPIRPAPSPTSSTAAHSRRPNRGQQASPPRSSSTTTRSPKAAAPTGSSRSPTNPTSRSWWTSAESPSAGCTTSATVQPPVGNPGGVAQTASSSANEPGPRRTLAPGDSTASAHRSAHHRDTRETATRSPSAPTTSASDRSRTRPTGPTLRTSTPGR